VGQILSETLLALQIQAETKQQTLHLMPSPCERYVYADKHKLERVFFNILSNAIKYTPEKGAITARFYAKDGFITIEVDDNGIGIPQKALPRVSQRYFRVGEHVAGTGLGLSIVREITELHKGKFQVESPVPSTTNGTRVTISLPASRAPQTLIVSSDARFIEHITRVLAPIGHELQVLSLTKALPETLAANTAPLARVIFDGSASEHAIVDAVCQMRRLPALAQLPLLVLVTTMEPLMRREYAKWRVDIRPRSLSAEELCALVRG
jgi:anti-sigma regulatory factor (Ser/Thr protein kinase)